MAVRCPAASQNIRIQLASLAVVGNLPLDQMRHMRGVTGSNLNGHDSLVRRHREPFNGHRWGWVNPLPDHSVILLGVELICRNRPHGRYEVAQHRRVICGLKANQDGPTPRISQGGNVLSQFLFLQLLVQSVGLALEFQMAGFYRI
jgi:hypothetical protein